MTILEAIAKWAGVSAPKLVQLIEAGAAALPDLAPEAQAIIAKLGEAGTPANLANLASAVISEIPNIAQGNLDPRRHPSSAG